MMPTQPDITDKSLAIRVRDDSDERAWNILSKKYYSSVYFLCSRYLHGFKFADIEILVSRIFYEVYDSIIEKRFNPEIGAFSTWLFRIAGLRSIDELRRQKRTPTVSLDEPLNESYEDESNLYEILESDISPPDQILHNKQIQRFFNECLDTIEFHDQEILNLYIIDEVKSIAEIARILKRNPKTILDRVKKSLKQLRQCLKLKVGFDRNAL